MSNYQNLYAQAVAIATQAHQGQTRWGGNPYIDHPLEVAAQFPLGPTKIVAVLHDVVEDSDVTADDLRKYFSDDIVDALVCLTHLPEQTYADYLMIVRTNEMAKAVKAADLNDNLKDLTNKKHRQRRDKYQLALKLLEI